MIYATHSQGIAAALRYTLGNDAHLRTFIASSGSATFEFTDDTGECQEIARQFVAGAFGVTDAKSLINALIGTRRTLTAAIRNKEWRNPCRLLA